MPFTINSNESLLESMSLRVFLFADGCCSASQNNDVLLVHAWQKKQGDNGTGSTSDDEDDDDESMHLPKTISGTRNDISFRHSSQNMRTRSA
jgi:hypothetical protein